MKSKVYLWENGMFEVERNCDLDTYVDQILYCFRAGKSGLVKVCQTDLIETAKMELVQAQIDQCNQLIRDIEKRKKKYQKVLNMLKMEDIK